MLHQTYAAIISHFSLSLPIVVRRTKMPRISSKGKCNFCQAEFSKSGMTKHLETCKARAVSLATDATSPLKSRKTKTKLLHILVEGYRLPEYWMHPEIPGNATLVDL